MLTKSETTRAVAEKFLNRLGARDKDRIQELFAAAIDWLVPSAEELPLDGTPFAARGGGAVLHHDVGRVRRRHEQGRDGAHDRPGRARD